MENSQNWRKRTDRVLEVRHKLSVGPGTQMSSESHAWRPVRKDGRKSGRKKGREDPQRAWSPEFPPVSRNWTKYSSLALTGREAGSSVYLCLYCYFLNLESSMWAVKINFGGPREQIWLRKTVWWNVSTVIRSESWHSPGGQGHRMTAFLPAPSLLLIGPLRIPQTNKACGSQSKPLNSELLRCQQAVGL